MGVHTASICRYCGKPRPAGYSITCGRSECQEAAYRDGSGSSTPFKRRTTTTKRRKK